MPWNRNTTRQTKPLPRRFINTTTEKATVSALSANVKEELIILLFRAIGVEKNGHQKPHGTHLELLVKKKSAHRRSQALMSASTDQLL